MPRRAAPAAFLLALLALPLAGAAESVGITPAEVDVTGAQRGETYVRELTLQNQFDSPTTFTVEREGETGAWARVEPASALLVPPRTQALVRIVLDVPADAQNGAHEGALRFVAEAKERPDGSGFALRYAVGVPLHVELGGEQIVRLRALHARAADVEAGSLPAVRIAVVNEGNVRATAAASVVVLDGSGAEAARASNATLVRPGEQSALEVPLTTPLPEGTYRVRASLDGGEPLAETWFKVVPLGALGKEGELRYLRHEPLVQGGLPVRVSGIFENTGTTPIARARLVGEVWQGERLVAVFSSDELAVPAGETVELVSYFTSPVAGELRLVAHVVYDGFRSAPNEGLLTAGTAAPPVSPPWMLLGGLGLGLAAAVAGALVLAKRRR